MLVCSVAINAGVGRELQPLYSGEKNLADMIVPLRTAVSELNRNTVIRRQPLRCSKGHINIAQFGDMNIRHARSPC
ncbi:hypothetical protein G6F59_018779 [Rhizopus arrhizus]|nr:hypothetical protein G6F59_018779 [Rhizopus arrhizus]